MEHLTQGKAPVLTCIYLPILKKKTFNVSQVLRTKKKRFITMAPGVRAVQAEANPGKDHHLRQQRRSMLQDEVVP
jgi:hypothetical protein